MVMSHAHVKPWNFYFFLVISCDLVWYLLFLVLASAEALNAEKNFVINFKSLIDRSLETLSLWQVLNEHNVEDVILHLDVVRHYLIS